MQQQVKILFFLSYMIEGYLNEVSMEQLIEEEFENKFWLHISHQS